jgi:hypothetical protein
VGGEERRGEERCGWRGDGRCAGGEEMGGVEVERRE